MMQYAALFQERDIENDCLNFREAPMYDGLPVGSAVKG